MLQKHGLVNWNRLAVHLNSLRGVQELNLKFTINQWVNLEDLFVSVLRSQRDFHLFWKSGFRTRVQGTAGNKELSIGHQIGMGADEYLIAIPDDAVGNLLVVLDQERWSYVGFCSQLRACIKRVIAPLHFIVYIHR